MGRSAGSINRIKKERWEPTAEQLKILEKLAGIRLPREQIADFMGIQRSTLDRASKYSDKVREAINVGRSKASVNVRQTLYHMATVQKDFKAIRFWCMTQEGFKMTERVEHTGADGGAIVTAELTPEQRKAELDRLLAVRAAGMSEDEDDDDHGRSE